MATICACPANSRTGISDKKGSTFTHLVHDTIEEVTRRSDPLGWWLSSRSFLRFSAKPSKPKR